MRLPWAYSSRMPIYSEGRSTRWPTTLRILRLFEGIDRHAVLSKEEPIRTMPPKLTALQRDVLVLLGVPETTHR
jgi:hypothetical protein